MGIRIPEWAANQARGQTAHQCPVRNGPPEALLPLGLPAERRCVIPVSGWFEWRPENGWKQPYWLRPEGTDMFSLAGIWEPGSGTPGSIGTFVILTMAAAPAIADIHHRQPFILDDEATTAWLRPGAAPAGLISMTKKGCGSAYDRWPVSSLVNSPRNDSPDLLVPAVKTGPTGGAGGMQLGLL